MSHNHNKIILLLMIKNESKIIERCIGRALEHVDAVCILDTGSTDDTVEICNKFLESSGKPFKVSVEPFKDFGYNRSVSFQKAQELCKELEWDAETTYAMAVDADMIIKPSPEFKDYKLSVPGYRSIQTNGHLKYYNVRFMKCSYDWKCVGVTHEYWSGDPTDKIPFEIFHIQDVNDGGCKSDKFERDIRLLTEDLKTDPTNGRTHFYLAQSYKDSGKFEDAITHYKLRIKIGGWIEEVWYSHYQIAKCYELLKNVEKMEAWANKAFKFYSRRAEPIYYLTKYFREHSEHYKSYHYYLKGRNIPYPKDDVLFIEHDVYNGLFDYENTILACYVNGKTKQDGLYDIVKYINTRPYYIQNCWDNTHYYVESLTSPTYGGEYSKFLFPEFEEFKVSSCSILPLKDKFLLNTRYVNYSIDAQGRYHIRSTDGNVKTKNGVTYLNSSYFPTEDVMILKEDVGKKYNKNIQGLEDVRLFSFKGETYFTASTKNLTDDERILIALGWYKHDKYIMDDVTIIEAPRHSDCEKNWIFLDFLGKSPQKQTNSSQKDYSNEMNFIYGWHPLEIGAVNMETKKLEIHTKYDTPAIFGRFRGSSNMCEYNGRLWCTVHYVKYSTPRVYYHAVVGFNKNTVKPEVYSLPFCFRKTAIEYCLSLNIKNDVACFIFSQNDSEPGMITVPFNKLRLVEI